MPVAAASLPVRKILGRVHLLPLIGKPVLTSPSTRGNNGTCGSRALDTTAMPASTIASAKIAFEKRRPSQERPPSLGGNTSSLGQADACAKGLLEKSLLLTKAAVGMAKEGLGRKGCQAAFRD